MLTTIAIMKYSIIGLTALLALVVTIYFKKRKKEKRQDKMIWEKKNHFNNMVDEINWDCEESRN